MPHILRPRQHAARIPGGLALTTMLESFRVALVVAVMLPSLAYGQHGGICRPNEEWVSMPTTDPGGECYPKGYTTDLTDGVCPNGFVVVNNSYCAIPADLVTGPPPTDQPESPVTQPPPKDAPPQNTPPQSSAPPPDGSLRQMLPAAHRVADPNENSSGQAASKPPRAPAGDSLSKPTDGSSGASSAAAGDATSGGPVAPSSIAAPPGASALDLQYGALLASARRSFALSDFSTARQTLTRAVGLDPGDSHAWLHLAEADNRLKRYDEAEQASKRSLQLASSKSGWEEDAWALFKQKRYAEAAEAADKALALDPRDAKALMIRARALWGLGRRDAALADAKAAAALDPRYEALAAAAARGADISKDDWLLGEDVARVEPMTAARRARPWALLLLLALACGAAAWVARRRGSAKAKTFSRLLPSPKDGLVGGKYELRGLLGSGGMGQVFEAFDKTLSRVVAAKKMSPELTRSSKARDSLVAEARAVAGLHHPNIVEIYEIVEAGGELYLIFELVRGKTVDDLLAESQRLPLERALDLLGPITEALAFAHARGLVHRDLKPSNIMVTDTGFVKLMDFGIARSIGPSDLAHTQTVMGTPYYMAPEMFRGEVRKEGDVYALAVCAYRMLTGARPFESEQAKLTASFEKASRRRPGLPTALDEAFERALRPDPERRTRTPRDFLAQLEAAVAPERTPPQPAR